MIVYDSKSWTHFFISLFKTFKYSYNLRQLAGFVIYATFYTVAATLFSIHYLKDAYQIDPVFFSLVGVILSLFLVFRLNTGYKRWWQGRQAWGKLVNDCRTFALHLNTIISKENDKSRRFFCRHISNFCTSLVWHLRDDMNSARYILENGETKSGITSANHQPNRIASFLFDEVEIMYRSGQITDFDKFQAKSLLQGLIDVLGICERIKKTPIPFSHNSFIKIFILIYILILPFGLVSMFEYLTIPAVIVMAFAMLGIEIISEEIENPFGLDANDLPTGQLANTIKDNVYEILRVDMNEGDRVQQPLMKEAEILH